MLGVVVLPHVPRQQVLRLTAHDYGDHHGAAGTSNTLRRRGPCWSIWLGMGV